MARSSAPGRKSACSSSRRLAGGLEVGLLRDPLACQRAAQLVVHHLDLLVHEEVRDLERGVLHRVVDDPVGEPVAGPVQRVAAQPLSDLRAELGQVRELALRGGERVVRDRQHLLAQLPDRDREVGRGALQRRLLVVERERDVELGGVAGPQAHEMLLEARDQALLADHDRHALRGAAFERLAVAGPDEPDHGPVVVLGATVLHRHERRLRVAKLVDHPVHLRIVDRVDLGREGEGPVVAQVHLGTDRDRGRVSERLPFIRLDDLDGRATDGEQLRLLRDRCAIGALHELLHGFLEDRPRTELTLDHGTGRLARPKPGNPGPLAQRAGGVGDGPGELGGRQLDLEDDGALLGGGCGDVHGRQVYGRPPPRVPRRAGGRGGGRTHTSLT